MATPPKPNSRLGTYALKAFKDEAFKAFVPLPLPPDPPPAIQPLLPLLEQANQALGHWTDLRPFCPIPGYSFTSPYGRKRCRELCHT
jgi:hypothetical protein